MSICGNRDDNENDCVVRAIVTATGLDYAKVAEVLCRLSPHHDAGKPIKRGFLPHVYWKALEELGIPFTKHDPGHVGGHHRPTLTRWLRTSNLHAGTICLVSTTHHLFCVSDGILSDHTASRCRVKAVYVLTGFAPAKMAGRDGVAVSESPAHRVGRKRISREQLAEWVGSTINSGVEPQWFNYSLDRYVLQVPDFLHMIRAKGYACGWKKMEDAMREEMAER